MRLYVTNISLIVLKRKASKESDYVLNGTNRFWILLLMVESMRTVHLAERQAFNLYFIIMETRYLICSM